MNYSRLAGNLRAKIADFSGYVSEKLDKTSQRFIYEALYGILQSQSVMLTEIGRSLETDVPLKKVEERFCRQLIKNNIWENIHEKVLEDATSRIKEDSLLILDLSDIYKKYAAKMQYLAQVRDGSEQGAIVNGYWTLQVIGTQLNSDHVVPLYHELYSQNAPDFVSENRQILDAIDKISQETKNKGTWVIDRGGDRDVLYDHLLNKKSKKRFIIRLVGSRLLVKGKTTQLALPLAYQCKTPYNETIIKEENGQERVFHISYGYIPVKLPDHDDQLYMLVVHGFGEKPMMLLTTEPLRRNRRVLYGILNSYLKRWSIEETIRFVKQTYDMENIRLLKYKRLRNMMALLLAVFYFLAVKLDTAQKLKIMTGHILQQAKRVFGIPDFRYYALGDGISAIFKRSPNKLLNGKPPPDDFAQIGLNFA